MTELKPFIEKLNNLFGNQEGLKICYSRQNVSCEYTTIDVWLQKYLDELYITEFSFVVIEGQICVSHYVYDNIFGYGYYPFPFEIILHDETKEFTPNNIKEIRRCF